jgi:hypothetical protein
MTSLFNRLERTLDRLCVGKFHKTFNPSFNDPPLVVRLAVDLELEAEWVETFLRVTLV